MSQHNEVEVHGRLVLFLRLLVQLSQQHNVTTQ